MDKKIYDTYIELLRKELVPALGCTEPIAIALATARARAELGNFPEEMTVRRPPHGLCFQGSAAGSPMPAHHSPADRFCLLAFAPYYIPSFSSRKLEKYTIFGNYFVVFVSPTCDRLVWGDRIAIRGTKI